MLLDSVARALTTIERADLERRNAQIANLLAVASDTEKDDLLREQARNRMLIGEMTALLAGR